MTSKPINWGTPKAEGSDNNWGIGTAFGAGSLPNKFAVAAGIVCLLLGVVGFFVTGFSDFTEQKDTLLLGLFHLTPMYNVALLGIGGLWLFAGLALTTTAVEGVNFAMAGFFVLAAVLGYLGALPLFGIPAGFSADVLLLVVLGVVSLLFAGLVPARR
ncbi:DUF4383 domain-containing protein [Pseudonocardia sp.]|uniref:DUF4383 domain-containing protein n=1 Tax=Pseudonocardia sp. TaxID=60912 RepID=UPI003D142850